MLKNATLAGLMILGALAGAPRELEAQTRADSAAVLLDAARRFENEARDPVARALYDLILSRFGDTPAAAAIRARSVTGNMPADNSGRTELLVWSTGYGLSLGMAVPVALGADEPSIYGLGLIAGAPAGYLAARRYLRDRSISEGQARAITFGGSWGAWQGFGLAQILLGGDCHTVRDDFGNEYCSGDTDASGEEIMSGMILGSLAGVATGAHLARKPIDSGTATTVSFGGLWGTAFGAGIAGLADLDGDAALGTALAVGNAGLLGAALGQRDWQLSRSRARLISIAGVGGALVGAGTALLVQTDDEKVAILLPMLGATAGLIAGAVWTRGEDAPRMPGGGDDDADAGALLEWKNGDARMGSPMLSAVRRRDSQGDYKVGIHVPLFSARF